MPSDNYIFSGLTQILSSTLEASLRGERGPSTWEEIGPADFGTQFDFDIEDHGSIVVIDAYSNAALQWLYYHLPEDCPRWGAKGFAIEANYVADILLAMEIDGLMSRAAYERAMEEEQLLQAQAIQSDEENYQ